jgi:hypothetical protein
MGATGEKARPSSTDVVSSRSSGAPVRSSIGWLRMFVIMHAGSSEEGHGVV